MLYSMSTQHLLTPGEIELSLGLPSLSAPSTSAAEMQQCVGYDFASLPFLRARQLAGNGMHAGQLGAFYAYVLSRCIRRCVLEPLCPPMPTVLWDSADLEEGSDSETSEVVLVE
eukprot:7088541-Lingulodinium_polyedra.AAC.1